MAAHLIVPMGSSAISSKSSYLRPKVLVIIRAGEAVLREQAGEHSSLRIQYGLSNLLGLGT